MIGAPESPGADTSGIPALGWFSSTLPGMDALSTGSQKRHPGIDEVLTIARRYCELIDASGSDRPGWLREVANLLPRLHAAMTSVHYKVPDGSHDHPVNLDARFELYSHLRKLLADRDGYFLEFDRCQDGAEDMTGSLADDLTDIYCELKHGLRAFESNPGPALETWVLGYEWHWSQHLADASRHLANLDAARRLD